MTVSTDFVLPPVTLRIGSEARSTGGGTHTHINPATGEAQAQVPLASAADIDDAVNAAHAAFALWRATPGRGPH